jgi:hypothetical protein
MKRSTLLLSFLLAVPAWCASAARDVGAGAANIGKGTAGAVGNLATGHPINAAASLGKGVGKGGTQVAMGAGKGVGKLGKGVGVGLKKLTRL